MQSLEIPEAGIITRYQIYEQLEQQRQLLIDPDVEYVMKRDALLKVDWLLDCMLDLDGINCLEAGGEG